MLLIENANIVDIKNEMILESDNSKAYYVSGPFLKAEHKNKNRRTYPKHILEKQVGLYTNESIITGTSWGELSHPNDRLENIPDRISHRITEFTWDSNIVFGKAKLLDTPMGNIAKALIEDGEGKIGMSSRGSGSVKEGYVQDDYKLYTVDLVLNPSVSDAMMTLLREREELLVGNVDEMSYEQLMEDLKNNKLSIKDRKEFDRELISRFKMIFK